VKKFVEETSTESLPAVSRLVLQAGLHFRRENYRPAITGAAEADRMPPGLDTGYVKFRAQLLLAMALRMQGDAKADARWADAKLANLREVPQRPLYGWWPQYAMNLCMAREARELFGDLEEPGFHRIFDGKTLAGWEGPAALFAVSEGAILGRAPGEPIQDAFLISKKEYGDIELRVEVKSLKNGNGGIQFWSKRLADGRMAGFQADVADTLLGSLYDENRRKALLGGDAKAIAKIVRAGQWNDVTIRAEGKRIRTWINGQPIVDYTEKDDAIPTKGLLGLQIHGSDGAEVRYKNLRIMELDGK
jgi:hypothetical protein